MGALDLNCNIFDETGEFTKLSRECPNLVATLLGQHPLDSSCVSVPTIVIRHFSISFATAMGLVEFSNKGLGEVEDDLSMNGPKVSHTRADKILRYLMMRSEYPEGVELFVDDQNCSSYCLISESRFSKMARGEYAVAIGQSGIVPSVGQDVHEC
jgi:hypothetical protein